MKPSKSFQQQVFGPLRDLTLESSAQQMAVRRFDFGQDSTVCRHLIQRAFAAIEDEERRQAIVRVAPFILRLDWNGCSLPVSLLNGEIAGRLVSGEPQNQVQRSCREALYKDLLTRDPDATLDDLRRILAPIELIAAGRSKHQRGIEPDTGTCRMDLAGLRKTLQIQDTLMPAPEQLPPPPAPVVARVGPIIEKEGKSAEMARSFISHLIALRERFCPLFEDLAPGQLQAVALCVTDRRMSLKTRYRSHVPVRLTLYTQAELAALERLGPRDRDAIDEILQRRVARILTEAYCQGGLLSLSLVGIITHQHPARISRLVDDFEARHHLVLPTPGTIHDAGSKLTHKTTIVRMHLTGMDCKEIARQTFHCEEAVGRYIDDFERVLIAKAHGVPQGLIGRILKLADHVVTQYEELITHHIGDIDQVKALLQRQGIAFTECTL